MDLIGIPKVNPEQKIETILSNTWRVLFYHDVPRINKFSLSCDLNNDVYRIEKWISTAVMRNAREFNIILDDMTYYGRYVIPDCLFVSKTLEVLKIDMDVAVVLPSKVCLPRLKVLILKTVSFDDYHSANLLFASLALEELGIYNCKLEKVIHDDDVLIISATKLLSLTIDVNQVVVRRAPKRVIISAPALENFNFRGEFTKEYHLQSSSSIFKATLGFHKFTTFPRIVHINHFTRVLISLQSVKYLELSNAAITDLPRVMVPIFKNLISLEIFEEPAYLCSPELELILMKCPNLETLRFPRGIWANPLCSKVICSLSTLINIIIGGIKGDIIELYAVHTLLKSAALLEILDISFSKNLEKREEIENTVSAYPRGSKSCKLCFTWPE